MAWHRLDAGELLPDGRLLVPVQDSRTGALLSPEVIGADHRLYGLYRPAIDPAHPDHDLFDGFGNGSLHMILKCDLTRADLHLDFHPWDWEALFLDRLGCPAYDAAVDGADNACHDRWRGRFTRALSDYPLLARIHDLYADTAFAASELPALRAECERARTPGSEPLPLAQDRALRKLLYAVGQAGRTSARTLLLECD
jgi:hypothetical protein